MEAKVCLSTKRPISNDKGAVSFSCPSCNEYTIIRSSHARQNAIKYKCPNCGFEGPN